MAHMEYRFVSITPGALAAAQAHDDLDSRLLGPRMLFDALNILGHSADPRHIVAMRYFHGPAKAFRIIILGRLYVP